MELQRGDYFRPCKPIMNTHCQLTAHFMPKSQSIKQKAADDAEIRAYEALPNGPTRGGLVVVHEIFGDNGHIRRVAGS